MRVIKFKIWDIEKQIMLNPALELTNDCMIERFNLEERTSENVLWLQFTGLKDKNNVDIYEGDILKCWDDCVVEEWSKYHIGVVIYHGLGFTLKVEENHLDWFHNAENIEVIGSLKSNPELLK